MRFYIDVGVALATMGLASIPANEFKICIIVKQARRSEQEPENESKIQQADPIHHPGKYPQYSPGGSGHHSNQRRSDFFF